MSTKIIEAVRNNLYSQLMLFLRHNYNFKVRSEPDRFNVLMIALEIEDAKKRLKMFQFLLNQVDLVDCMLHETDNHGRTVFFRAVLNECVQELALLLKSYHAEIDWKHKDATGNTLLHHAVEKNNLKMLELLLNVCAKYKINVDIPNDENKITPYLLACRLHYSKAADLLLNIGHASKMQADLNAFYDAERWKQEGQVEKFNSYLKSKEQEMSMAKLYGRVKVFNELNHLATTLDTEVVKNPNILPILAKVIIDHDNEIGSLGAAAAAAKLPQQAFAKSRSLDNISLSTKSPTGGGKLPPIYLRNSSTSFMYNRNGKLTNNINYLSSSVSSSSSQAASSPRSSASSSKLSTIYHHRYPTPHRLNSTTSASNESNNFILSDLNTILKHTMNSLIKQRNNQSPAVNSLLEMTDGRQVENFVASKPDDVTTSAGSTAHSHGHGHHGNGGHGHHHGLDITSVFYAAAMEKTGSYRVTAKINNEPIMPKIVKAPKPKKASSLAIIREESRVSSNVSKKSSKNGLKKQSAIQSGEGLRKLGKPPAIKVAH